MIHKFKVALSPHVGTKETVRRVMLDVVIALLPIYTMAFIFYREQVLKILALSVIPALLSEYVCNLLMKKKNSIFDGSALVTALLFALIIPPNILWWQIICGSVVAIILGKMVFGGLGQNIFNPAFVGLAFLMNSWPIQLTRWGASGTDSVSGATLINALGLDGKTGATPLELLKWQGYDKVVETYGGIKNLYSSMLLGNYAGTLGEVSILAILMGAAYLFIKRQITWHIPITYIATVYLCFFILGKNPLFHIMTGGIILGAFFMATDMVSSPVTSKGKIIFAVGLGLITVLIRLKGGYYEGVCYSILFMNSLTPLINKMSKPRVFGE